MTAQASHNDLQADIRELAAQFATYREESAKTMRAFAEAARVTSEAVERIEDRLGEEPDSDGQGGRGLIGDLRRQGRDMRSLMDLRKFGMGAVMGVSLFGALIILGVIHWVEGLVKGAAS